MLFFLLSMILAAPASSAPMSYSAQSNCSTVDLRPKLPPVRNQDSIGWCYAFATADLLSHHTGQHVSAPDIALGYNQQWYISAWESLKNLFSSGDPNPPLSKREGGESFLALTPAFKRGVCLEKDFPSIDAKDSLAMNDLLSKLQAIEKIAEHAESKKPGYFADQKILNRYHLQIAEIACTSLPNAKSLFPQIEFEQFHAALLSSGAKEIIQNLANRACTNRIRVKPTESKTIVTPFFESNMSEFASSVGSALQTGKPLAISYDSEILQNIKHKPAGPNHVSVIAGRRWNRERNRCELLLRNSWGTTCSYDSEYSCEKGNVWIPEGVMLRASYYVDYLQ